jgi:hypothetical protein
MVRELRQDLLIMRLFTVSGRWALEGVVDRELGEISKKRQKDS